MTGFHGSTEQNGPKQTTFHFEPVKEADQIDDEET
jgi:hypothetical protein